MLILPALRELFEITEVVTGLQLQQELVHEADDVSTSSRCTISTVVCMYLRGNEIRAEATPSLE
jgi:hypothetical protein